MRIRDLRDWRLCLESIRQRLDYSNFKAAAGKTDEEIRDHVLVLFHEIDQQIAEGMLRIVVSLPMQEAALSQLEQFAAQLESLQPDRNAGLERGLLAEAYQEFFDETAVVLLGMPAVVETFKVYAEGSYDVRKEVVDVLKEAQSKLRAEPQVSLKLVGEAGSLSLRGLGEMDDLWLDESSKPPKEPLDHWIEAVAAVVDRLEQNLKEFPLGEVELARDQWRAPDDKRRIEYKKGKLTRLGIVEPEVQALLLPLLAPENRLLSTVERKAIIAGGPKVVEGLIAVAGDDDLQMESSIGGGEASVRAVQMLGIMRAAEAVPTLLEILKNAEWMWIIHDQTLQVLQDEMPDLAFDMALEMFGHTTDVDLKSELAGILAKGGRGKPGVFERLIKFFRKEKSEQGIVASYLADLGDPRVLPDLHDALRGVDDWLSIGDIEEAIIELGGELSAAEQQKLQRREAQMLAAPSLATPLQPPVGAELGPVWITKIGRNEPCPCGSGKKYKKCCGR